MLGNFSFGDYFKEQAIPFAWELLTNPVDKGGFGFPEEKMWVTVYLDDDEAIEIWKRAGVPAERIQRRDLADNYWHMGVPGPGGPCSEIYFDRGPEYGREGGPIADETRYLEVWNNVFMQYTLGAVRTKIDFDVVGELPAKSVDTGMGLERMAAILQGVDNIYEIDTTFKILSRAAELTGTRYGAGAPRRRVAAGHRRPPAGGRHARRRRRAALQRGPGLRAAPHAPPGDPQPAPAGLGRGALHARAHRHHHRRDGPAVHRPDRRRGADPRRDRRRGGVLPGHPAHRHDDLRHRGQRDEEGRRRACWRATRPSSSTTPTASRST